MSDSPKCPLCLDNGVISQTYRMAGSVYFKCHTCAKVFNKSEFEDIDYKWATHLKDWLKAKNLPGNFKPNEGATIKNIYDKKKKKKVK